MTIDEERQSSEAVSYIKSNKTLIIDKFANSELFLPDDHPIALFMAGSPGAGKTEVSRRLIERFDSKPVRIDADEIREIIPGYNGGNSYIFQAAANKGVNILYDSVLANRTNVILDGTFAYRGAEENIRRALNHGYEVEIYYIYQDPEVAWDITKKRESVERRYVSREVFISAFVKASENVRLIKQTFAEKIELNIIIKDLSKDFEQVILNVASIDEYIPKMYSIEELSNLL